MSLPALNTKNDLLKMLYSNHHLAVNVFFILSGRVIANSVLKNPLARTVFDTSVRRVFRLVLPILFVWTFHWVNTRLDVYPKKKNFQFSDIFSQTYKIFFMSILLRSIHLLFVLPLLRCRLSYSSSSTPHCNVSSQAVCFNFLGNTRLHSIASTSWPSVDRLSPLKHIFSL
jgi:peptidoglycan/LPS O-acetylase OafA/YrhL